MGTIKEGREGVRNRLPPRNNLLEAVQTQGLPGLVRALRLQIDPNGPSAECIAEGDACFQSAATGEQVWDCANDMAQCLSTAPIIEEPPEVEEPPPPPPPPPPDRPAGQRDSAAVAALATLLVHLHGQTRT